MDGHAGLIGELAQGVLFEIAESVTEDGDCRLRLAVGGGDRRRLGQLLLVQHHFELIKIEPLTRFVRR